jgi:hypothetical protein
MSPTRAEIFGVDGSLVTAILAGPLALDVEYRAGGASPGTTIKAVPKIDSRVYEGTIDGRAIIAKAVVLIKTRAVEPGKDTIVLPFRGSTAEFIVTGTAGENEGTLHVEAVLYAAEERGRAGGWKR